MHFMHLFWELDLFSALFLLRELHTVHTADDGIGLQLLPVALGHLLPAKTEGAYGSAYGFSPIFAGIARR